MAATRHGTLIEGNGQLLYVGFVKVRNVHPGRERYQSIPGVFIYDFMLDSNVRRSSSTSSSVRRQIRHSRDTQSITAATVWPKPRKQGATCGSILVLVLTGQASESRNNSGQC